MTDAKYDVHTGSDIRDAAGLTQLAKLSVELILRLQDGTGAYPASPTFSAYRGYCWFRDGAFIADAMSAAGARDSAERFFDWCARILIDREAQIHDIVSQARSGNPVPDANMLPTRFTFAGGDGEDEWWDFQLDGFGTWLWAVAEHTRRYDTDLTRWSEAITLTVDYLTSSWHRPCFDWWEENADQVHVSTLACIAAGLDAVATNDSLDSELQRDALQTSASIRTTILKQGLSGGHLAKWLGSAAVDASTLSAVAPLGLFPAPGDIGGATLEAIDRSLNVDGGVHRYLADTFFGGGQWPLLSCFLGLGYAAQGDRNRALHQLSWAAATSDSTGALPEQVGQHLLDASMTQEWVDRWGPVAQPLLWSHAMFIRLAVEVGVLEVLPA
ncbi:glycoside hydrolase family 15 protein [Glaciihabitans sp. UYNi722]|uniref:glycoside hydrolase family 15 protein n=1 Tax=Glaciihabitans sp. UYNi722 TaxID=3156344 RepID=UPI0033934A74